MAMGLADSVSHILKQANIILYSLKIEWESSGTVSIIQQEFLREMLRTGMVDQVAVADVKGNITYSIAPVDANINIANREPFLAHRDRETGEVYIYVTMTSDALGNTPALFVSRRLNDRNGEFAGIVSVGIRQANLLGAFQEMDFGADNSLSLLHMNGMILARIPGEYDREAFATVFRNHPSLPRVRSGEMSGAYQVPGADGIPRLGYYRRLSDFPIIALATTKQAPLLQDADSRQTLYRNTATAFSFIIALAAFLLWLQLRKQYRTELVLRSREKELTFSSFHDALTGIYNRAFFYEKAREAGFQAAVIMADLDGLKVINDTFGHKVGDSALVEAARLLGTCIPADAVVARVGGDEFAVLLPKRTREETEAVCSGIKQAVDAYNTGNVIPIQLSLGFAVAESNGTSPEELVVTADKWMYREKLRQAGTHRSQFINTLKEMLVARDYVTEGHVARVAKSTLALAKAAGLPMMQMADMELFAYFHDIGKVGVSDAILNKCGPLSSAERTEMQLHSEIGHRIASATDDLSGIADWILQHHERWDGQGYPWGAAGEQIPIQCRILAITDAYDAMTSNRPYRQAMSGAEALAELQRNAGTQFDPELVKIFATLPVAP